MTDRPILFSAPMVQALLAGRKTQTRRVMKLPERLDVAQPRDDGRIRPGGSMTKIEWTDATWNPIVGCSIVSPGCTNCYAMKMAARLESMSRSGGIDDNGYSVRGDPLRPNGVDHYVGTTKRVNGNAVWTGKVALASDAALTAPLRRRKPTRYFVNSMGDLFHEDVPDGWIMTVFDVMFRTPHHTYQVLTKRSARMRDFMRRWSDLSGETFEPKLVRGPDATRKAHPSGRGQLFAAYLETLLERSGGAMPAGAAWPTFDWADGMICWPTFPANVWLGVSAERQQEADARIPDLLATPAAVRFVSAEPLLGPIDFTRSIYETEETGVRPWPRLDWIIVGGESGPSARPMHPDWARSIRDQCTAANVPFFFKQWGEWAPGENCGAPATRTEQIASWFGYEWMFSHITAAASREGHSDDEPDLYRIGKSRAGRHLDGREWSEFPGTFKYDQSPTDPHHGGKVIA